MTATDPRTRVEVLRPRRRRVESPLRASALRIELGNPRVAKAQGGKREAWQQENFEYFDDVGIVKAVIRGRANLMAKLRLFAAVAAPDDPDGPPIPVSDPQSGISPQVAQMCREEIRRIRGASGATAEVLRQLDMNAEIAGEGFVVGIGPREKTVKSSDGLSDEVVIAEEEWDVRSVLEVNIKGDGQYEVPDVVTGQKIELSDAEGDVVVRFWQRHPGYAGKADCHMRGVTSDCEALVLLTNEVKAESKSRQNNGLLLLPNTLQVVTPTQTATAAEQLDDPEDVDDLEDPGAPVDEWPDAEDEAPTASIADALEEAIMEPISDPGSPWSVWPLIFVGPAEELDRVKHLQLHRDASEILEDRIAARKEAIAQGLNMPIEFAKGHQETTFANAKQVDIDKFEDYLEPSCVMICDMWTDGLLRPALDGNGVLPEVAERIFVWYDPVDLIKPAAPEDHVSEAHGMLLIGDPAARRLWGYSEDDAPTPEEMLARSILQSKTFDPGLIDAVIRRFDPTLEFPEPQDPPAPFAAGLRAALDRLARGDQTARGEVLDGLLTVISSRRTLRASATSTEPEKGGERLQRIDVDLLARCPALFSAALTRALERAGNRLKARPGDTRRTLRAASPLYAAARLGPSLVASMTGGEDLIDADAFDQAIGQYRTWAGDAQKRALAIAAVLAGLTASRVRQLAQQQDQHLADSCDWLQTQLHDLAEARLYEPDPTEPAHGEFDPTARVPAGLVRAGLAIAGGATALEFGRGGETNYSALQAGDQPPGGIGTGELLQKAIADDGGLVVEAWQWDYGQGYRLRPYEPHLELDGQVMESAVDFVANPDDSWAGDYHYPGDHNGCQCGPLIPVYAQRDQDVTGGDAGTGLDDPEAGAPMFGGS